MATLKDMSTRELINALRSVAEYAWDHQLQAFRELPRYVGKRVEAGNVQSIVYASKDELRAELTTRPHVPSKHEAQMIRRLKSQTGQSEEWLRAHPKFGQMIGDARVKRHFVTKQMFELRFPYVDACKIKPRDSKR